MNAVDATEHYDTSAHDPAPSLLTVILDTNPHAWALLEPSLPLSKAIANILVFLNAHLACNYANEVAVVASHNQKATWLYPRSHKSNPTDPDGDISMNGGSNEETQQQQQPAHQTEVNKYRPFRIVEEQVTQNLRQLMESTTGAEVKTSRSTMMAGALTLALSHINRRSIAWAEAHGADTAGDATSRADGGTTSGSTKTTETGSEGLQARILIVSRLHIPIDVCKLGGDAVFLQQASDATKGVFMALTEPKGLLQYLMMAFLPDQRSRKHLVLPTRVDVDFRAACFCHRRVVDIGFVCSICLSIFCEPPENGDCLTCGSHLEMGDYGAKPALIARKKKKKKARLNGPSETATPTPTPGP
ncbi:RNA polymerase II transcription factor B subunit 4 [Aspergillus nanangensis]|uniref:General transcription and DNA repair factor IIH subunit TFB4 n=1 Tax=Aspergillus nanangensis TaxID=2582783 RepID=A0AAD4CH25_ASPNN|nr:RNA polymerase II transcription factor B subunit 4 [Aspergillus nanangensis]